MRSSLARVALSKIGAACSPEVVRKSEPCSSLSGSDRSGYEFGARTSAARASGRPAASRCSRDPGQKPIPDPDPETRSKPQPWVIQIVVGGESRLSLTVRSQTTKYPVAIIELIAGLLTMPLSETFQLKCCRIQTRIRYKFPKGFSLIEARAFPPYDPPAI